MPLHLLLAGCVALLDACRILSDAYQNLRAPCKNTASVGCVVWAQHIAAQDPSPTLTYERKTDVSRLRKTKSNLKWLSKPLNDKDLQHGTTVCSATFSLIIRVAHALHLPGPFTDVLA